MKKTKQDYKQTEIGEIPQDWELTNAGSLVSTISQTFDFFKKEEVVFLNTGDVLEGKVLLHDMVSKVGLPGQAKKSIQKDDILFSEIRPKNKRFAYIDFDAGDYVVSTKLMVLRTNRKVHPRYFFYYITSEPLLDRLQSLAESRSGTFPQITFSEVSSLTFALPPIQTQKEIVDFIKSLDKKIELNRKMNETLEEIGKALFKHWFVDFEFPNKDGKPYKSSGGEMVDSELSEIPKGWEIKPLDEIADFLNGLACQKYPPVNEDESLPVIKIAELRRGFTDSSDRATSLVNKEYIVSNGDVLFSWSGSLEVYLWLYGKGVLNQHLFKVTSKQYPKWFFYYWLLYFLPEFRAIASGKATTMGHIQRRHLKNSIVLVPDRTTLNEMDAIMQPILVSQISNNSHISSLGNIRDNLLPRLMSGRIRV